MPILPPAEDIDCSLPRRFREQVERHPDRAAVRFDGGEVSYRELFERALRVAAAVSEHLRGEPGAVVLLVPQGIDLIAAILGVLEAGAWYVPLDPAASPEQLRLQTIRAEARLVLCGRRTLPAAVATAGAALPVLRVDEPGELPPPRRQPPPDDPAALAYVYFTSGTLGPPKGVMDSHRNVLDNVHRYTRALAWTPEDRLTLLQSSHFSGAVSNVFGALLNGALLLPYDVDRDGAGPPLASWIAREQPTIWHSVPSLFRTVCLPGRVHSSVRVVRLEGDAGSPGDVERFERHFASSAVLVHGLGATETGISCQHFVRHGEAVPTSGLPVGRPVEGVDVRLLDERGAPVARGEAGEIVVRGRHLALGYWRDPERTARAFRDVPGGPGLREYRSGDLGRLREDGAIEHLGRLDQRFKVRGHWVEAAAVEARLVEHPDVSEAAVSLRPDPGGEPRLAAHVTLAGASRPTATELRRALARDLPEHAVPAVFLHANRLPLGAHGKLDRRALATTPGDPLAEDAGTLAPRDACEAALAAIWCDVLGLEHVGVRDRFTELGGDSLAAVRVEVAIEQRLGLHVKHSVLAEAATIEELARQLGGSVPARVPDTVVALHTSGARAPLFCVHDLESDAFLFGALARRLGAEQPVYALRPATGEPASRVPRTIGELAARYLADIAAMDPSGPRRLVGFCFGGVVALEMARQLAARGRPVELLVLVNVTAHDLFALVSCRAQHRFRHRWSARIEYLGRKSNAGAWIAGRLGRAANDLAWRVLLPLHRATRPAGGAVSGAVRRATLLQAFRDHVPTRHEGAVVLFLADETLPLYADDPREAWAGLATGPIEIHRLPCDGYTMLMEPDVATVAERLRPHLEA